MKAYCFCCKCVMTMTVSSLKNSSTGPVNGEYDDTNNGQILDALNNASFLKQCSQWVYTERLVFFYVSNSMGLNRDVNYNFNVKTKKG